VRTPTRRPGPVLGLVLGVIMLSGGWVIPQSSCPPTNLFVMLGCEELSEDDKEEILTKLSQATGWKSDQICQDVKAAFHDALDSDTWFTFDAQDDMYRGYHGNNYLGFNEDAEADGDKWATILHEIAHHASTEYADDGSYPATEAEDCVIIME